MKLLNLSLLNYRNYETAEVEFSPNINLIFGLNAQGKTNFLEAVYLLCLSHSFRQAKNQELLKKDTSFFSVKGLFKKDNELEILVAVQYLRDGKKELSIDRKKVNSHSKIFGHFPVVVMAPDEFKITSGNPSERRRFLDILLSQVSLSYLKDLQEYNRIIKQRNKILRNVREGKNITESAIEPWTEILITIGTRIIKSRRNFITDFSVKLNNAYKMFDQNSNVKVCIESSIKFNDLDTIENCFRNVLIRNKKREKSLGITLAGPHRDDILFEINGMDLRKFGSRGEHKSLLISLKIAEFEYLKMQRQETPILLLDDCYSELDNYRELSVFNLLYGRGQIFFTSPKKEGIEKGNKVFVNNYLSFTVNQGKIAKN